MAPSGVRAGILLAGLFVENWLLRDRPLHTVRDHLLNFLITVTHFMEQFASTFAQPQRRWASCLSLNRRPFDQRFFPIPGTIIPTRVR